MKGKQHAQSGVRNAPSREAEIAFENLRPKVGFVEASPSLLARCVPAAKSRWIGHDSDSGIWKKQQQQKNSPSKDYNNQNMFSVTNDLTTVS